jgi:hypothetical protein
MWRGKSRTIWPAPITAGAVWVSSRSTTRRTSVGSRPVAWAATACSMPKSISRLPWRFSENRVGLPGQLPNRLFVQRPRPLRSSPVRAGRPMDRASDYGSEGWGFESLPARQGVFAKLAGSVRETPHRFRPVAGFDESRPARGGSSRFRVVFRRSLRAHALTQVAAICARARRNGALAANVKCRPRLCGWWAVR